MVFVDEDCAGTGLQSVVVGAEGLEVGIGHVLSRWGMWLRADCQFGLLIAEGGKGTGMLRPWYADGCW